ncbi:MAG: tetratricopeptide repeat protein [Vicinamibacterales bacterium]
MAAVVIISVSTGCVAGSTGGLANHLIRPGEPEVVMDAPIVPGAGGSFLLTEEQQREVEKAVKEREQSPRPQLPTLEGTNPRLRDVLQAAELSPTVENRRRVASEYRRLGILDKAFDYLTLILEERPDAEAYAERAQVWRDWGWSAWGLGDAYRAVDLAPRSAMALNTLGTVLQAMGQGEAARDAYLRALDVDPSAGYVLNNLCFLSFVEAQFEQATHECESALVLDPGLGAARHNLALAHAATGRIDDARNDLLAGGDAATGQYNLGMIYLSRGEYGEAEEAFLAATEARPAWREAHARRRQAARLAAAGQEP